MSIPDGGQQKDVTHPTFFNEDGGQQKDVTHPTFLMKKMVGNKKTLPTLHFLMKMVGNKKTLPTLHLLFVYNVIKLQTRAHSQKTLSIRTKAKSIWNEKLRKINLERKASFAKSIWNEKRQV